jgi:hypothetical protein
MVSPEGACAAYFNYGRFSMASERHHLNVLPTSGSSRVEQGSYVAGN